MTPPIASATDGAANPIVVQARTIPTNIAMTRFIRTPPAAKFSGTVATRTVSHLVHRDGRCNNGYLRMLTALAITSTTVASEMIDWIIIVILAHLAIGNVSVGLNAAAFVNERYR